MAETMKNRGLLPVGTRVRPAYAKLSTRVGTVVAHSEERGLSMMQVRWDGDVSGCWFMIPEVRKVTT